MEFLSYFIKSAEKKKVNHDNNFRLPISYIEKHSLSPTVASDLELDTLIHENSLTPTKEMFTTTPTKEMNTITQQPIYHHLFQPKHTFARELIPQWKSNFTSNRVFLEQSQSILLKMGQYRASMSAHQTAIGYTMDENSCKKIKDVWSVTKNDALFLEKYGYMELELLKSLNRRPLFLQTMSLVNMTSPVMSFLIPVVMLILPFFLLKIQGVPISMEKYIEVLSNIAKHHIIGKSISAMQNFSASNLMYFILMVAFYFYQIYQNYQTCLRFYRNMKDMNDHLMETKLYLSYSIHSIQQFTELTNMRECSQYTVFHSELQHHLKQLQNLQEVLSVIQPFTPSLSKLNEIGTLLRCFYELYDNDVFGESLKWSFGFEGYMNNLLGVFENLEKKHVAFSTFSEPASKIPLQMADQVYPPHLVESFVKNDCVLDKNMIITGPNAAGKTTFLKTTIINVIISQQLGCGYYSACTMTPYQHIHSYLNIPDTSARDSLFQAESRRCKEILDAIDVVYPADRHFCVFDELYSGTNPMEATKSAYAFLLYLAKYPTVDFILTTHYVSICKKLKKHKVHKLARIRTWKMEATCDEEGAITYTYKIRKGVSKIQGAICVLRAMEYPKEILHTISEYA